MASLRKNFSYMLTGRAVYAATQWLLIIALARLTSPESLGHFTYALAITGPVIIFFQLNMRAYMATDAVESFRFSDYLATRVVSLAAAITLILIATLQHATSPAASALIVLVGLYKSAEAVSDVYYGVLQKNERLGPVALSVAVRGIAALLVMVLAVILFDSIIVGAAGILTAWVLLLTLYDRPMAVSMTSPDEGTTASRMWRLARACFPMGLVLTLMSLRVNIPVYFIRNEMGTESVGYYSAVSYFLTAGALISGSLAQTTSPRLARLLHAGDTEGFVRLLYKLLVGATVVGLSGVLVAALFGDSILAIFYGASYARLDSLLVVIMLAASANYLAQLLGMSLTVARLLWFQLFSNGAAVLMVFLVAFHLVPSHGLVGGGIALLCGVVTALVCNGTALAIKLKENSKG